VVTTRRADRSSIERWLKSHGVPNFVEGYANPARVIPLAAVAAVPVVVMVLVVVLLSDLNFGFGLLAVLATALATLAVAAAVLSTGLIPLASFGLRWFGQTMVRGGSTMLAVLPLLLVAVAFLFLGAETWQSVGRLHGLPLVLTALLFASLGVVFVVRQVRPDLDDIDGFTDQDDLRAALPKELDWDEHLMAYARMDVAAGPDNVLRPGERLNLHAVTAIAQIVVAVVVGLAVFAFFLVFGILVVDLPTVQSWSTEHPEIWWQASIVGHHYALTSQHVRVSAFLGVFSALYFVVSASTDKALRASLTEGAQKHARTCLAVRAVYRGAL